MNRLVISAFLGALALFGATASLEASGGGGGGHGGGGGGHGGYGGGYGGRGGYGYGRGYGYGYGGFGLGIGLYGYGYGGFYPGDYGYPYAPYPYAPAGYPAPYVAGAPPIQNAPAMAEQPANIRVIMPDPRATVVFNGHRTTSTGLERSFHTPALAPGKAYNYRVSATWMEDGREVTQDRQVQVLAGQTLIVDFTAAAVAEKIP